ncbi:MAG: thioether cross-link-forming SCIFF peptide maturase [bacterium]|jgi:uncharacterized protein
MNKAGQVHTFKCFDTHLALDVESGSLHVIDELMFDLLKLFPDKSEAEIMAALVPHYGQDQVLEAWAEVEKAQAEGLLFSPPVIENWALSGEPVLKALCLHVAHDCNLRCRYCFGEGGEFGGPRELMSFEVARKAVDLLLRQSKERALCEIDFFGGEPLLNLPVVRETVDYARREGSLHDKNFKFTLTTNGVLLTEKVRQELTELGLSLVLSLDGRQEVQDYMRPLTKERGSYDRVVPNILATIADEPEGDWWVRGTFTRHNKDFATDAAHLLELGIRRFSLEPVVALPPAPYALTADDLPEVFAEYERLAQLCLTEIEAGRPLKFFHFEVDLEHGPCLAKRFTGCGAGHEYFAVAPNGDIYPCHQFVGREGYKQGSVKSGIDRPDLVTRFRQNTLLTKDECRSCFARYFCGGGCHANADLFSGNIHQPYELGCQLERKRVELALYLRAAGSRILL